MKRYTPLILAILLGAGCSDPTSTREGADASRFQSSAAGLGKIVVNHDEWTLSDAGIANAPDAAQFARNLANYFTGGSAGNFLVYSTNFGLTGTTLATAMQDAGHTWTVDATQDFTVENLLNFDAVFLAGTPADNAILIDYVNAGGNVYLAAGTGTDFFATPEEEVAAWNTFLAAFNLSLQAPYNTLKAIITVTPGHPLFESVTSLYFDTGNSVAEIDPANPDTEIILVEGADGLIGVFFQPPPPNEPPVADAGEDQEVECSGDGGTVVTLDGSASSDPDGDPLTYTWAEDGVVIAGPTTEPTVQATLGLGVHVIELTVEDGNGGTGTDEVTITVSDTQAPILEMTVEPTELWSPNHKLRLVAVGTASDACCDVVLEITVESSEPANGRGDGNTEPDYEVVNNGDGSFEVWLRAERSGNGPGRVYTITATATDCSGNTVTADGSVKVPHDQGRSG
ncbi:MAG: hypothetical protein JSU87_00670 [Gemmatimonadota bacterium]|nr:MAG: hypothetical protein JSU87_00670 [Gemmatimonadota bacterium]